MILGIIPARFASSRFPGKPLAEIQGKSMIRHVYERASQSTLLTKVIVATDDDRILKHVESFGGLAVMTSSHHPSGTDRCVETLDLVGGDFRYVINIQGDEPLIDVNQINELAGALTDESIELATQMIRITSPDLLFDAGEVKIVLNDKMEALYFSRSPIPYLRNVPREEWHLHHQYYRHAGLYAYRTDILRKITALPVSPLEKAESLEQLRWLEHGFRIKCIPTKYESLCVDTPDDISFIIEKLKTGKP